MVATLEVCLRAWVKGHAVRRKRPADSCGFLAYAPSGLLRGIDLPAAVCRALAEILP